MSAECHEHGCHLLGYMEDAFCPVCRYEAAEQERDELRERVERAENEMARMTLPYRGEVAWRDRAEAAEARVKELEALDHA